MEDSSSTVAGPGGSALESERPTTVRLTQLEDAQRATLNILEDFETERQGQFQTLRAVFNLLEDSTQETRQMEITLRAIQNIMDDLDSEREDLTAQQRATLNLLEDFDLEKTKVELAYREMHRLAAEREAAERTVTRLNAQLESRAADLERANEELQSFSYSVSHDLRAPLRAIDGFSRILLDDYSNQLPQGAKDHLTRVVRAAGRMGSLIDALLQLTTVGREGLRWQGVDLSGLARDITEELRQATPGRVVEVNIAPSLTAVGDVTLLRVALTNLLANAWKFTSTRHPARIEFGRAERDGVGEFFVRDNGVGFSMAQVGQLFQPFKRLHDDRTFPGTGIGLATVARVIRRHGGTIRAVGQEDGGATILFRLGAPPA